MDVKILDTTKVKTYNDVTIKDMYSSLLSNREFYTADSVEYGNSLQEGAPANDKNNTASVRHPKFLIRNCTLIGNAVIATPGTPNFDVFPARLSNYTGANGGANSIGGTVESLSDLEWVDEIRADGSFYAYTRMGNALNPELVQIGNIDKTTGKITAQSNAWLPEHDGGGDISGFKETSSEGILKYEGNRLEDNIKSEFSLQKNQPFALRLGIFDFTEVQKLAMLSEVGFRPEDFQLGAIPEAKAFSEVGVPRVNIIFGGNRYKLTVFQNKKIRLFLDGKQVGDDFSLPGNSENAQRGLIDIVVYPLGNILYVYSGTLSTEATLKRHYAAFTFPDPVDVPSGPIILNFKCGKGKFNFSPVVHNASGTITSPFIGLPFAPDNTIFNPCYVGKFGVGARESPISFPEDNDRNKVFSYLKDSSIEYAFTSVSEKIYTYTLTINPNRDNATQEALISELEKTYQQGMRDIETSIATNQANVKNGSITASQAVTNIGATVQTTAAAMLDKSNQNLSQLFRNLQVPSEPTSLINGIEVDLLGILETASNQLSNGSFTAAGSTMGKVTTKAKNALKKSTTYQKIVKANQNIYSPAVFFSQVIFKKDLEDVNMSPNPQIENSDVMQVTVNQAVESQTATIVLNNRNFCGTGDDSKGRYTYIPGMNNFCGVKPVQIKIGYKGEQSGAKLPIVFTGYITRRNYSRAASNQSIVTCTCEDASKKAKEQFAVNLPFFDGWCSLAVMYYLAKQAGYADDEILLDQDPRTGTKTRIRDLLVGDPDTFTGGCFDGHVNEDPPGIGDLAGSYLHMTLPLASVFAKEEPNYNFAFGTPLWTCMQRVREFNNFYLYANNFGNIVFGPPKKVVKEVDFEYREVDIERLYNEYQDRLDVDYDTSDTRNMVFMQGQTFVGNINAAGKESLGQWVPHIHIKRKPNFPNDIGDHSFSPWIRYAFMRNPKWEFPSLTALAAEEIFRRLVRLKAQESFSAWGNSGLFPYDIITLRENLANETGIEGTDVIIAAHTLSVSSDNFQPKSSFTCETVDRASINYDATLVQLRE